ncbi:magnesium transporter CorA [Floricoccus penangensis]|uniref:Magnesium transporter CorA n=1 Tax=Floricoccus penangensis TaxID=1859475 RepID=A0A9Q5P0H6_9LACT|nr:magnesium transporter CorA family protein [Floricoccus penangensis]OFI47627.1 magnesium transporter CorA [Floricoccus penangensis]
MIKKTLFNDGKASWINIQTDDLDAAAMSKLYKEYDIDDEILMYSLDKNERAHIEYNDKSNTLVLIYNVANINKTDNHYETVPMAFLAKNNSLVTLTNRKNNYIAERMNDYIFDHEEVSAFKFLFASLFMVSDAFFPLIEEMDTERKLLNDRIRDKTTKQNLFALSDLETGIVYMLSASKQNAVLLEQLKAHSIFRALDDVEREQLEDASIEAKQLVEMTNITSEILSQLSATYNNVLNNNLNDTMKILTVLSILLTIPTIITGFFGMNMPLPLENNPMGWIITIAISVAIWFALSWILNKVMEK